MLDHIGKILSGTEFNKIFAKKEFYKLTKSSEVHFGFKFKDGINVDIHEFIPKLCDTPSGLHFTDIRNIPIWTDFKTYIRKVSIPDDAIVVVGHSMYKTNKIFLHERTLLKDFYMWKNLNFQFMAIKINACNLRFIKNPPECVQKMAVRINPNSLYYIEKPSLEVQKIALCNDIYSYYYIKNPSVKIIHFLKLMVNNEKTFLKIVSKNNDPLEYVYNSTIHDINGADNNFVQTNQIQNDQIQYDSMQNLCSIC